MKNKEVLSLDKSQSVRVLQFFALVMVISVAVGLWLRASNLESRGLWSDELYSVGVAYLVGNQPEQPAPSIQKVHPFELEPEDHFWTWKLTDPHPPLYELILSGWIKLFGQSDISVRMPSVIFGSLLVLSGLMLWRENFRVACFYTSLMALSVQLVFYSQEARNYSLSALLCGLLLLSILRELKAAKGDFSQLKMSSTSLTIIFVAAFTHYYSLIFSGAVCAIYAYCHLRDGRYFDVFRMSFPLVLLIPYLWFAQAGLLVKLNQKDVEADGYLESFFRTVFEFITFSLPSILLYVIVAGAVLVYALSALRKPLLIPESSELFKSSYGFLFLWLIIFLFLMGVVTASAPFTNPRYLIFGVPLLLLLIAIGLDRVNVNGAFKLACLHSLLVYSLIVSWDKTMAPEVLPDYRNASRWIADKYTEGDRIVASWKPNLIYYLHYLSEYIGPDIRHSLAGYFGENDIASMCNSLDPNTAQTRVFFFFFDEHKYQVEAFEKHCSHVYRLSESQWFQRVSVNIYLLK